jgi:hypothetical protein
MALPKNRQVRHFHTKIVGVTHKNADGSDRQRIIKKCGLFERLTLDHEESNPHDPNAVRVCRPNGQQLGYLSADLAPEIVSKSKKGYRFGVFIKDITGGKRKGHSLGVNLLVIQAEPGITDRQVTKYAKALARSDPEMEGIKVGGGCLAPLFKWLLVGFGLLLLALLLLGLASGRR